MFKINSKIIFPTVLLVIVIAAALFFIFLFKTERPEEPSKPGDKILTQEEMYKFYQDLSETVPGTKKYINSYTLVENLGEGEFKAEISSAPRVTPDGKEINVTWTQKGPGLFEAVNNFFTVTVNDLQTTVSAISDLSEDIKKDDSSSWDPQIFLNEKEVMPFSSTPILLEIDPQNENYHNNVLEWDYGILKRRLEIVEGSVFELYFVPENPKGDLVIKSNSQGNLKGGAYYALDGSGKHLRGFKFTNQEKILEAEVLANAIYPVIVDDSFSGQSRDGFLATFKSTYSSARTATIADYIENNTQEMLVGQGIYDWGSYKDYEVYRGYLYFDTASIPASATIDSAYLRLFVRQVSLYNTPITSFDVSVKNGQPTYPHIPLELSDFNRLNYSSSLGGTLSSVGISAGGYNNLNLTYTGLGWIQKGAYTKLVLMSSRDISGFSPAIGGLDNLSQEYFRISTAEGGVNSQPLLVITFTLPATPAISVTPASLSFGNVNTGTSSDLNFTVQNTGGGTLTGSISGLTAPFSCVSGCSYSLGAGASQVATIRFIPTSVGSFSDTAEFSGAAGDSRSVSGSGITARCIPVGTMNTNYTISTLALGGSNLCEITGDDGVEGGNLTISAGVTVQINANSRLVFNDGKSIFVDGIIAKSNSSAKIVKGNLTAPANLNVSITATPNSGAAPLNNVSLTATVSGTATGNIRYQFDCTDDGSYERDYTTPNTSYTASNLCSYSSTGIYSAKVQVDRGGVTTYNWATITVSPACVCSSGTCCDGCNYRSSSYECRASAGDCDVAEYCTGSSTSCPSNTYQPSSYVCNTWTEYDYQCTGTGCGDDAQSHSRTNTKKCTGSSANCSGSTTYGTWSSWATIYNCNSTEKCNTDNSTYASCSSDTCCGSHCGNGSCDCSETYSTCSSDCPPPNPANNIQGCMGVNVGSPIADGVSSDGYHSTGVYYLQAGDLLVRHVDGSIWCSSCNGRTEAHYCKVGRNCAFFDCTNGTLTRTWTTGEFSCTNGSPNDDGNLCEFCIVGKSNLSAPIIVNTLPNCGFTTGDRGDIFVKHNNCAWSSYKCTITGTRDCGWISCGSYNMSSMTNRAYINNVSVNIPLTKFGSSCVRR